MWWIAAWWIQRKLHWIGCGHLHLQYLEMENGKCPFFNSNPCNSLHCEKELSYNFKWCLVQFDVQAWILDLSFMFSHVFTLIALRKPKTWDILSATNSNAVFLVPMFLQCSRLQLLLPLFIGLRWWHKCRQSLLLSWRVRQNHLKLVWNKRISWWFWIECVWMSLSSRFFHVVPKRSQSSLLQKQTN